MLVALTLLMTKSLRNLRYNVHHFCTTLLLLRFFFLLSFFELIRQKG